MRFFLRYLSDGYGGAGTDIYGDKKCCQCTTLRTRVQELEDYKKEKWFYKDLSNRYRKALEDTRNLCIQFELSTVRQPMENEVPALLVLRKIKETLSQTLKEVEDE